MTLSSKWWSWVFLVVSVAALGMAVVSEVGRQSDAACQAEYNEINNERTRILTDVGAQERDAERRRDDALDRTFLDPSLLKSPDDRTPADRQHVQALFREYLAAAENLQTERAAADKARRENPVPPPPSQICD